MLLQDLQRYIINIGISFRFYKEMSLELYLLDDLKTYMESRSTSDMKKGWNYSNF